MIDVEKLNLVLKSLVEDYSYVSLIGASQVIKKLVPANVFGPAKEIVDLAMDVLEFKGNPYRAERSDVILAVANLIGDSIVCNELHCGKMTPGDCLVIASIAQAFELAAEQSLKNDPERLTSADACAV